MRNNLSMFSIVFLVAGLAAQSSPASRRPVPPFKIKLPQAAPPSEFELLQTRYRFENDGTGFKEVVARIRILSDFGARQWIHLTFDYKPFDERLEISYIRILKKQSGVVEVASGGVPRPKVSEEYKSFYDEKRIDLPSLSPGDAIEYDVKTIFESAMAPGQFWIQHNFRSSGTVREELAVDLPQNRDVKVKAIPTLRAWVTDENGRQVYHWSNLKGLPEGYVSDPIDAPPDVQLTSFARWEEVGRWYANLEKPHRNPSPEIRAKADELTTGLGSDLEKVEALYDFAAKKIRYISLASLGIGGYEPHSAAETLQKGYGDCKDKAALLAALLEAESLHASTVLINPRRELDRDLPSPSAFNHVITVLPIERSEIWMDPSSAVLPFRMLPYPLRAKQALVVPHMGLPYLTQTPADAPALSTMAEEIDGKINDQGTLEAKVSITARGDAELVLRQAFVGPVESSWPWTLRTVIRGISPADEISNVKVSTPTVTSGPFTLSFQMCRNGFILGSSNHSELKLPLSDFPLPSAETQTANEYYAPGMKPFRIGPPGDYAYRVRLEIMGKPEIVMPPSVAINRGYASYRATYKSQGNTLTAKRELVTRKDKMIPTLAGDYESFRRTVVTDIGQSIKLHVIGL